MTALTSLCGESGSPSKHLSSYLQNAVSNTVTLIIAQSQHFRKWVKKCESPSQTNPFNVLLFLLSMPFQSCKRSTLFVWLKKLIAMKDLFKGLKDSNRSKPLNKEWIVSAKFKIYHEDKSGRIDFRVVLQGQWNGQRSPKTLSFKL